MKRLVLLGVLLCFASGDVFAQGALRRQVGRMATQVKNVFTLNAADCARLLPAFIALGVATGLWLGSHLNQIDVKRPLVREVSVETTAITTETRYMELPWWGVEIGYYRGTGVWQDNQGNEGELKISLVTEIRGYDEARENIWLTISYGEEEELKIHKSMFFSDYPNLPLFSLDGFPVNGEAYIFPDDYDEPPAKITYQFIPDGLVKLVRLTKDGHTTTLSGTIEEDGRTVQWDNVKLTFIKGVH